MLKSGIKHIQKNIIPISVAIICLHGLYLRIMHLYNHTLWADELYSLGMMRGTFSKLLDEILKIEYCTYLSGDLYLEYPFFKIFSYNKWGLAAPRITITIAGFYILYLICKRYFKSIWAYLVTFGIVCFNATLIEHATEIRIYAILPTLALATFYLFQRIADLDFKLNIPKRICAIIIFVTIIWFYIYGILMFMSCFLFVLLSRYKDNGFKAYFINAISFTGIVLCFAMPFWLYCVFRPHYSYGAMQVQPFIFIPDPMRDIVGFLKCIFCNLIGFKKLYFLFLGAAIPFILSYEDRRKQLLFLFFIIIVPIIAIFFSDLVSNYWFLQRQFIWVMPLFAFFLGWAWDSLFMLSARLLKRE